MTRARKHIVCLSETPYYHVSSRCVRRAFLCGTDRYTGKSYEHRKGWIEDRIRVLTSVFSIELCAYAVMSNHYHLVVKLTPGEAATWSDDEVLMRWSALFRGPLLVQRYRAGELLTSPERETLRSMTAVFRSRLTSLSWFMKCLNEPIARRANAEDDCTGHFWEARFHSVPLRSDQALIAAMAYVDLNPVRAGLAASTEASSYTSIRARLEEGARPTAPGGALSRLVDRGELRHCKLDIRRLMPFADAYKESSCDERSNGSLPISEVDYLQLVDLTRRSVSGRKLGDTGPSLKAVLERLNLSTGQWISVSTELHGYLRNGTLRLRRSA